MVEFFSQPTPPKDDYTAYLTRFGDRTPAPHELRLDVPTRQTLMTRWGATVTSFGPWIKIPMTAYFILQPIAVLAVWSPDGDLIPHGPGGALVMVSFCLAVGLGLWPGAAMWRPGKVDTRPSGTR